MSYKQESHAHLLFPHSVQIDGTLTVGVDDTGYDVQFFGATASTYMLWDENTDDLVLTLGAELYFYDAAGGEHIKSDGTDMTIYAGTDLNLTVGADINIATAKGLTFGDDGQKIESDGTDFTIASGAKLNLTPTSDVHIANGTGLVIGHTAQITAGGGNTPELQILGLSGNDSIVQIGRFGTNEYGPALTFLKSRDAAIADGSFDCVEDDDSVGRFRYAVDDGVDFNTEIARIEVEVDDGSPAEDAVGGAIFLSTATTSGAMTEALRIDSSQGVYIGDSANAGMTIGLTINQAANDNQIFAGKSSDVTHVHSSVAETDTYFSFEKQTAAGGGLFIRSFSNTGAGFHVVAYVDDTDVVNTDTTSSFGVNVIDAIADDGSNGVADVSAGNIFVVRNNDTARLILKEDGELHIGNTTLVTLSDNYDDAQLLRAYDHEYGDPATLIRSKYDEWVRYHHTDLVDAGIIGRVPESAPLGTEGLWNISQHLRVLNGAAWQGYTRQMELEERLALTESKLLALEAG
jgi:hypothetical protein